ncbi:MAG: hypothetical protein ACYS1C_10325, partial [Planctomycetota bacterium]
MPGSVLAAVAAVGFMVVLRGALGALALATGAAGPLVVAVQLGIVVLVFVGLLRRNRLAWQWGRYCALLGALLLCL